MSEVSADSNVDDLATSIFFPNGENLQNVMVIPGRLVFDNMLEQLGLPKAQYEQDIQHDAKICVTIIFQTPDSFHSASPAITRIARIKTLDGALAEHSAAAAAIRFMETQAETIIGDLSYGYLRHLDRENDHLRNQVKSLKQLLKKRDIKAKKLTRGWYWAVRKMFSFSAQFRNVAVIANLGGQVDLSDEIRATFGTVYGAAQELESQSRKLESKLDWVKRSQTK